MPDSPGFAFAAIGLNHNHIYGQTRTMLDAGCRLKSFYGPEDDLAAAYGEAFPQATRVADPREILEDPEVLLVVGAGIASERAPMAVEAMHHGKDVMLDKPAATTLEQLAALRQAQAETGRILSIFYSEHLTQRSTIAAGDLVQAGAIGRVIQTIGLGPHREGLNPRPDWFYDRDLFGGIICDIAAHQTEQFLFFTGSEDAQILSSQVGNYDHPNHPKFEDFGQFTMASDKATGFVRVDWFTAQGLPTWGDGRTFLLGTEGTIELRKYIDIAGRPSGDHLFIVDQDGVRYQDCSDVDIRYGKQLRDDVLNRTETAMSQRHCFKAMELALQAQAQATWLPGARPEGAPA